MFQGVHHLGEGWAATRWTHTYKITVCDMTRKGKNKVPREKARASWGSCPRQGDGLSEEVASRWELEGRVGRHSGRGSSLRNGKQVSQVGVVREGESRSIRHSVEKPARLEPTPVNFSRKDARGWGFLA